MNDRGLWLVALGWIPTLALLGGWIWLGVGMAGAQARTPFKVTRIYTGDDQRTHVEEYEVPLAPRGGGGATEMAEPIAVESVQFRRTSPDYFLDFHNAPRRQFVVTLAGEGEVELADGTKIPLYPGHILLAEDVEGQGHISRAVGGEDRLSLFLPLVAE